MDTSYPNNAGAVFSLKYHLVWCPKDRKPVLVGEVESRLRALLAEKAAELGMTIHALEAMPDHVHLEVEADPTRCVAEIVNRVKSYTSRVLRQEVRSLRSRLPCLWSRSSCELPDVPVVDNGKPALGIDVGLTAFLTTSEGRQEPNPRYLKDALPKLRRAGRAVARKKQGGRNRRKAVRQLQKVHARVRNLRREHHHQVARRLVLACGLLAVERLNVQGMLRNDRLARAISDAGWAGFLSVLRHKAEGAGVRFVEVDPRGTSQQCSGCNQQVKKDLSVRWHDCPHCGLSLDRDHNAALNILARARMARTEPVGGNVGHQVKRLPRSRRVNAAE